MDLINISFPGIDRNITGQPESGMVKYLVTYQKCMDITEDSTLSMSQMKTKPISHTQ